MLVFLISSTVIKILNSPPQNLTRPKSFGPKSDGIIIFLDFKNFIKILLNREYSRPTFEQWLNNLKDFVGRWLSEMIMLGCFSILSLEEHKKDFKLWVDENDFYNKDTT